MRTLSYLVHQSVDGFIAGPSGEFDWPTPGPELFAYGTAMNEGVDTFLYGRVVWEMMSSYWPDAESISDDPHDLQFAPVWRAMPKVVASRTLDEVGWNARVVRDAVPDVAALKAGQGGGILLTGGAGLASSLTAAGLIDDYRILVHPVVLGAGIPLFAAADERLGLRLVDSRVFDGRTVLLHYRREG